MNKNSSIKSGFSDNIYNEVKFYYKNTANHVHSLFNVIAFSEKQNMNEVICRSIIPIYKIYTYLWIIENCYSEETTKQNSYHSEKLLKFQVSADLALEFVDICK